MPQPPDSQRRTILVVDDDPATAQVVRSWYEREPFEVLEAADGERGLELAREAAPELILLDLRMPGVDGISVARTLKTDPRTAAIPVILLTACRDVTSKVEAFSAGADDYVTKPFEFEEVDARIRSMLRRRSMLVGMESEIKNLRSENKELEQLLVLDEKTGLYNFRHFRARLHEEWQRAERYGTPLSLVFFDIDNFKQVNDTRGHPAGDRALQEFATLVVGGARSTDIAARYGGEEFAMILPHTDGPMAQRVAERVRVAVEQFTFLADERPIEITVSGGIATYSATSGLDSIDALVRAADTALYRAKDLGKNRVVRADRQNGGAGRARAERAGRSLDPSV